MTGLRALVAILLLALPACSNTAGEAEFRIYAQSIDSLAEASQPVIDRLRVAERESFRAVQDPDPGRDFVVADAPYLADSGDPPLAAAVRASMTSLKRFNAALLVYAEGRGLDEARADLEATAGNLAAGFGALGLSAGAAVPAVGIVLEGVSLFGGIGSREAFRDLLREQGAQVDKLLAALLDKAPTIFQQLADPDVRARGDAEDDADAARMAEIAKRLDGERRLVSEWVLMVVLARAALDDARAAIDAPGTIGSRIGNAAALSADFRVRLERIRELAASIR